jgi:carboxymethylenebutenolidase
VAVKKGEGKFEVVYSRVTIPRWGENITGWLTRPQKRPAPALLMAPHAWGVTGFVEMFCHRLSREGYSCLAVDPYSRGGRPHRSAPPDVARDAFHGVPYAQYVLDLHAALEFLRKSGDAVPNRIAMMGVGDGGRAAIDLAGDADLGFRALVLAYVPPPTGEGDVPRLTIPVLGLYGAKDENASADAARTFAGVVAKAGAKPQLYVYPDAGHDFLDDERDSFEPRSAADAFTKLIDFLGANVA